jgi:hypothetical protein
MNGRRTAHLLTKLKGQLRKQIYELMVESKLPKSKLWFLARMAFRKKKNLDVLDPQSYSGPLGNWRELELPRGRWEIFLERA